MPVTIRPVSEEDWDGWKVLWDGHLDFYREHLDEATSRFTFDRLCGLQDGLFGFVAEDDGGLQGIVNALVHPSTWTKGCYCYLEDLFVARSPGKPYRPPADRGRVDGSDARGAAHVYWHTEHLTARHGLFTIRWRSSPRSSSTSAEDGDTSHADGHDAGSGLHG